MTIDLTYAVKLDTRRCYACGKWHGYETTSLPIPFPLCAGGTREEMRDRITSLDRTIASLRGQITKLKRGGA